LIQFHSPLNVAEIGPTRSIGVGMQISTMFHSIELVNRLQKPQSIDSSARILHLGVSLLT
jgi:hypothetical protein